MKKLITLCVGALLAVGAPAEVSAKTIYGYQAWEMGPETPFRGPITISSENPSQTVQIADNSEDGVVYGGFYCNYRWFGQVIVKGTQSSVDGLYEIDMTTGERTLVCKGGSKVIDLTYDYSSDKIYGIRTGNQWLVEYNPQTGESTLLGKAKDNGNEVYLVAIAAGLDGTLYVVSTNGNFYKAAKDGTLTTVGELGYSVGFDQTMGFDYSTGTLYWVNNLDYHLYTIDTTTGAATDLGAIGPNGASSMASLFVPYINVAEGAPDRVQALKGQGGADAVTLTWTNPTEGANGAAIAGFDGVAIERDGQEVATLSRTSANLGADDSYVDGSLTPGDYEYRVVPFNSAGRGGVDYYTLRVHVGKDRPAAVGNLTATPGDGSAILSWEAPTQGASGGLFEPEDITGYRIKRGSTTLATVGADCLSYEDRTNFGSYSYTVTALSAEGDGEPALIENVMVKPADWIVMCDGVETITPEKDYSFYDEGGPNGNYYNQRRYVLTVTPAEDNCYATVEFSDFSVDTYGDYLSVYNGTGTEDANLIGKFASTSVTQEMSHIESSAPDGSLTFLFYSDIIESDKGWSAKVRAERLLEHDLAAGVFQAPAFAVAGAKDEYSLAVTNKGRETASGYTVELLDGDVKVAELAGPDIAPRASDELTIEYAHAAAGDHAMSARIVYAADTKLDNNVSAAVAQSVYPEGTSFVELFQSPTSQMYVIPISFMSMESIFQIILPASDLTVEQGSELRALSFPYYACTTSYSAVPVHVWAGSTELTDLKDGSIPASAQTEVFYGTVDVAAGSASLDIPLTGLYAFEGKNVVLTIHKEMSPTDNMGVTFCGSYCYDRDIYATRFASHSNNVDYEPFDPDANFGYSADKQRPDIRLVFGAAGSGIRTPEAASEAFSLAGRALCANAELRVYSLQGILEHTLPAGATTVLAPGVHIVATPAGAVKILIK